MNLRKTLFEVVIIFIIAVALGFLYNFIAAPKPLAWVYSPRAVEQAADSVLFADSAERNLDSASQKNRENVGKAPTFVKNDSTKVASRKSTKSDSNAIQKDAPPKNTLKPKALEVTYEQVSRLIKDTNVLILDARAGHEFEEGHIPGAKLLPALEFEKHIPEIIALPRDKRIVVYCGGGLCELSHQLCDNLISFGFTRVFIYLGGWEDWKHKQKE